MIQTVVAQEIMLIYDMVSKMDRLTVLSLGVDCMQKLSLFDGFVIVKSKNLIKLLPSIF